MLLFLALFLAVAPITVTTRDHIQFAPGNVRVRVEIEPHPDNVRWCLEYDGGMYSRSCEQIDDGAKAPRVYQRLLKDLPAGEYEVVVTVYRKHTDQKVGRTRFRILAVGADPAEFEPQ